MSPGDTGSAVLDRAAIEAALEAEALTGWRYDKGKLHARFAFAHFRAAFAFMSEVALLAEARDHHPDWSNSYDTVDIALVTHSAGGVTSKDLDLARAIATVQRAATR